MSSIVPLTINYKGRDFHVNVEAEVASAILNDPSDSNIYRQRLIEEIEIEQDLEVPVDDDPEEATGKENEIWCSKGKPTGEDNLATESFLSIREKYNKEFGDKKTNKSKLWNKIAGSLKEMGFNLGDNGGEKCRQKFQNLSRLYIKHRKHMKTTGTAQKDPPMYFDQMHSILGDKHKVEPEYLDDSLVENQDTEPTASCSVENVNKIKNRFERRDKSTKPKTTNEQILEFMKTESQRTKLDRERQFGLLEKLVDNHINQQNKLLDILSRKRKRQESSSSEDD